MQIKTFEDENLFAPPDTDVVTWTITCPVCRALPISRIRLLAKAKDDPVHCRSCHTDLRFQLGRVQARPLVYLAIAYIVLIIPVVILSPSQYRELAFHIVNGLSSAFLCPFVLLQILRSSTFSVQQAPPVGSP